MSDLQPAWDGTRCLRIQADFRDGGEVRLDLTGLSALPASEVDVYADVGPQPKARRTGPVHRRNRAVGSGQIGALGPGFGPSWYDRTPYWVQVSTRGETGWRVWQGCVVPGGDEPGGGQEIVLEPLPGEG
jgi:hypothetical protein